MAGDTEERREEMKYRITIEVEVPDNTTLEDAEEYFQYTTNYSWQCRADNPLCKADIETTDFDITELN